jgi:hypothetical protein
MHRRIHISPFPLGKGAGGLGLLLLGAMPVMAQNTSPIAPPNGYEDLISAGKLVAASKPLQEAVQPNATLQQKRLATIDDRMDQGLRTLRNWLNQPDRVGQPGALADLPLETTSQIRMLARALAVEQYVLLASGRVGAAIDSARDGLRMSYAIKPNTLILWLVSDAVDATVTRTIAQHLEQLCQKDCDSLMALSRDWMAAPDPTPAMLDTERQQAIAKLTALLGKEPPDAASAVPDAAPPELKNMSKADRDALWQQVIARLGRMYAAFGANLNRPLWERWPESPQAAPQTQSDDAKLTLPDRIAANLFATVQPVLDRMLELRGKQQARARMAGCHAAIRNYKWEHDRLPASLDDLKLGTMATDPFTGESFLYKLTREKPGYTLQSAGPPARDENNHIKPGERQAFALSP